MTYEPRFMKSEEDLLTRQEAIEDHQYFTQTDGDPVILYLLECTIDMYDRVGRLRGWIAEAQDILEWDKGNCEELFSEMAESHLRDGDLA